MLIECHELFEKRKPSCAHIISIKVARAELRAILDFTLYVSLFIHSIAIVHSSCIHDSDYNLCMFQMII